MSLLRAQILERDLDASAALVMNSLFCYSLLLPCAHVQVRVCIAIKYLYYLLG